MGFSVKVTDRDRGYSFIKSQIEKLSKGPAVKVGVQGREAAAKKKTRDSKGALTDGPLSLVEIAAIHEFGNEHVPQRSYLQWSIREHEEEILRFKAKIVQDMLDPSIRMTPEKALGLLGQKVTAIVKGYFTSNSWEPLSPSTIRRRAAKLKGGKASNDRFSGFHPLIDTGQLRASITYVVVMDGRGKAD